MTTNPLTDYLKERVFLYDCPSCKRKHRMTVQPCPSCTGRSGQWIPMPASSKVRDNCHYLGYECDGCYAYRDHQR